MGASGSAGKPGTISPASTPAPASDPKHRPWINEFGINKIGMIAPASLALKEFTLPDPDARSRRCLMGFDPRSRQFTPSVPIPSGGISVRLAVVHEATGSVWFGPTPIARAQLP